MLKQIQGIHHVTSMAADANVNNHFFTKVLGLRRVKKTVNFDRPDVYHLYYGDEFGTPGSVMTYFPFPNMPMGKHGLGEVGVTCFSVPKNSLDFWQNRFADLKVKDLVRTSRFGEDRLEFSGPDGDGFALVEVEDDSRVPWIVDGITEDFAIRGFHSTSMTLADAGAMQELLTFMNYERLEASNGVTRLHVNGGNDAHILDLVTNQSNRAAEQGAGSVHHIAFAVENRSDQLEVRKALMDTGYSVTNVIDRDYFWAIYFRTPGGILFEIATNEPGFDRDEDLGQLGTNLKLPTQHEHLRDTLEEHLQPITD